MAYMVVVDDMFTKGPFNTLEEAESVCWPPSTAEIFDQDTRQAVASWDDINGLVLYDEST